MLCWNLRADDLCVIVKTKGISRQRTEVLRLLQVRGEPLPENLKVVIGGEPFQLLTESRVVEGFNTTAQLEALAAGKPVFVPWFDETLAPKTSDFVIDLDKAVEYASHRMSLLKSHAASSIGKIPEAPNFGAARRKL